MKTLKLSVNQRQYLSRYLQDGIPENINDILGDNQANIIKRLYKRITSNKAWELINKEIHSIDGYYFSNDLQDLITLLECKHPDTYNINSLNILFALFENCKEEDRQATILRWFIEWLNNHNIYYSFNTLKPIIQGLSINYPQYISCSFTHDLDNINLNK